MIYLNKAFLCVLLNRHACVASQHICIHTVGVLLTCVHKRRVRLGMWVGVGGVGVDVCLGLNKSIVH